MYITSIEYITKTKARLSIDGEFWCQMTRFEINSFNLAEDLELTEALYQEIEIFLTKKAIKKAMDLLNETDRTELELRQKLKRAVFSEQQIDAAIEYVCAYNYLNDERYAEHYIQFKCHSKSRDMLKFDLVNKGVDRQIIDQKLAEAEIDESGHIRELIRRKYENISELSPKERQNLINYLLRRGYKYDDIRRTMKDFDINDIF